MNAAFKIGISIMIAFSIFPSFTYLDAQPNLSPEEFDIMPRRSNITQSPPTPAFNATQALETTLLPLVKAATENSTNNPDRAFLMILSTTTWQASIMDSGNDFTTIDGVKTETLDFECTPGLLSTYSVSVQKQTELGLLWLELFQGGSIIDKGFTRAEYGIVSFSGECNKPG